MTLSVAIEHLQGDFRLDVHFDCGEGVTALFGRSGAGKTSVINAVAGLLTPQRGHIRFDGDTLFDSESGVDVPPGRRNFGYVFQEGRLFPHLTVERNLRYAEWFDRRARGRDDFSHIVELLGLARILGRRPAQLSGGEKQRVAIGRALLAYPRLLLLDEPLASLDQPRRSEILAYLERLRDEMRVPMLYVSHTVEEVIRLADRVVLMSAGRAVAQGGVEQVMGHAELAPDGPFEGGTIIDARVSAFDARYNLATLAFPGGQLRVANAAAALDESLRVRIRARDVSIATEEPRGISIQNVLRGTVESIGEPQAGIADVWIGVGHIALRARITERALDQLALARGMPVYALIKAISFDRSLARNRAS
ncbi:MAG TPA: molybdenum ABC transporter ATP-binding protein [Burkholderiales bacterium]|nr:molybdenum ABC transporter ATP-binding protein [Burkholderiales bacterium]